MNLNDSQVQLLKSSIEQMINEDSITQEELNKSFFIYFDEIRKRNIVTDNISSFLVNATNKIIIKYEDINSFCMLDSTKGKRYIQHLPNEEKNFVVLNDEIKNKNNGASVDISKKTYDSLPKIFYKRETAFVDDIVNEDIYISFSEEAINYGIDKLLNNKYEADSYEDGEVVFHIELSKNDDVLVLDDILNTSLIREYYPFISEAVFDNKEDNYVSSIVLTDVYKNKTYTKYDFKDINKKINKAIMLYKAVVFYFENNKV